MLHNNQNNLHDSQIGHKGNYRQNYHDAPGLKFCKLNRQYIQFITHFPNDVFRSLEFQISR